MTGSDAFLHNFMATGEGYYYPIRNYDKYHDFSNYRGNQIQDIRGLDEPAKPFQALPWAKGRSSS